MRVISVVEVSCCDVRLEDLPHLRALVFEAGSTSAAMAVWCCIRI